jgi:CubicO group peptidase (beta-lactamase class C family)
VGLVSHGRLAALPDICRMAVQRGETPGGVFVAGVGPEILAEFAFGNRSVLPKSEPSSLDTIYDLASLTKPIATTILTMQALEEGLLNLMEPVERWLPGVRGSSFADADLRHLLLHTSGLPAGCPMPEGSLDLNSVVDVIAHLSETKPVGSSFVYSDLGFHLLARIVERAFDDAPLAELVDARVLRPLGMQDAAFGVAKESISRCAPTALIDGVPLRGTVHDPTARQLGGVAGHAGLFATASDLVRLCRMILNRGQIDGERVLAPATVDLMIDPVSVPGGPKRSLGFDADTKFSNPRGEILPARGIGHTGHTGTSFWIDPPSGLYMILLTNRLHPDGNGDVVRLRRLLANVTAAAVLP